MFKHATQTGSGKVYSVTIYDFKMRVGKIAKIGRRQTGEHRL